VNSTQGQANGPSGEPHLAPDGDMRQLSADGRFYVFTSHSSNLASDDASRHFEVFLRDRQLGTTVRVSQPITGPFPNGDSFEPCISADGSTVAFVSEATNLANVVTKNEMNVYVWLRATGKIVCATAPANDISWQPTIDANGGEVAFTSYATNLVSTDVYGFANIYVFNTASGSLTRASVATSGDTDGDSTYPSFDGAGRYLAFQSQADNLVTHQSNQATDVFVRDLVGKTTAEISVDSTGAELQGASQSPSISSDGTLVAFTTYAAPAQAPSFSFWVGGASIMVRSITAKTTQLIDFPGHWYFGNNSWTYEFDFVHPVISGNGRFVAAYANDWYDPYSEEYLYPVSASDLFATFFPLTYLFYSVAVADPDVSFNADGTCVALTSAWRGLIPDDTNGVNHVYVDEALGQQILGMIVGPQNNKQVLAGAKTTGTLALMQPAPAGGLTVALSSNSTYLSVPATVTVPAGAMSVPVTLTTSGAESDYVIVTATGNSRSTGFGISLVPVLMTLASYSVTEGTASIQGTISVSAAPTTDQTFSFQVSGETPPISIGNVILKAGTASVNFKVPLAAKQTPGSYTVATWGDNDTSQVNFTVTPPTPRK
jgi:hypothetical protein